MNKKFKKIGPEAVKLIEGSLLTITKYTNIHALQCTIGWHISSYFRACGHLTNVHSYHHQTPSHSEQRREKK